MSLYEDSVKPTIKASFVSNVLQGFERSGGDSSQLLQSAGLKPVEQLGNIRISVAQFYELTLAIENTLHDEMLGFMTNPVPPGSNSTLMGIVVRLPTLLDVLEVINDFYRIFNSGHDIYQATTRAGKTRVTLLPENDFQNRAPYYIQRITLTTYKVLCWISKTRFSLNQVQFSYPVENDIDEFRFVFDCARITTSTTSYIEFENDILSLPVLRQKTEADEFAKNFSLYTLLWPSFESLASQIRSIVGSNITDGFPSFESVAEQLGTSSQTLSRRLHDSGTSYQAIKDDIRRDAAIALLMNSEQSVTQIAYQIGFKEAGSFTKAFKKWLGVTPTEYLKMRQPR